ncbi:MAG: PRC and DUF2382 domain-containing protein [Dermatophilaceae bacterium]|nr:PRC and DUF2382 domain-containing protein [Dermatophilaceae bacterium]
MITTEQLHNLSGATVYGPDQEKIGRAGQVYLDDDTGRPEWLTVNTGLFGTNESFVPLRSAELTDDGLTVAYHKDLVKDAPNVDPDNGHLDRDEEQRLFQHYGLETTSAAVESDDLGTGEESVVGTGRDSGQTVGTDTSGPATDDAMTRSEEQLNVGTETREAGRARLRKYVVTEEQNVTVPVTREEVKVEREPITDTNRDAALSGPDISEEEHEVVLHEEQPVVEKEAVPVERVRLDTEQVTEEHNVTEEIRKEQIDADGDGISDRRR